MKKIHQEPLVSIVVPVAAGKTVESLLAQTYRNLEIIVLSGKAKAVKDKRLKLLHFSKTADPFYALNFALKKARGKFLGIVDGGDIAFPDRVERQVDFLLKNPEAVFVGGKVFLLNKDGEVFGEKSCLTSFVHSPVLISAALINRKALPKDFVFYHGGSKREGDLELLFRLKQYGRVASLEEKVLYHPWRENVFAWKDLKKDFNRICLVRERAVRDLGYQPKFREKVAYGVEKALVNLLPGKLAFLLLETFIVKKVKRYPPGLALGWRSVFPGNFLGEIPKYRVIITFLLAGFVLNQSVQAAVRCETQYGGGETCREVGDLILDKKVWDNDNKRFEDNLADISPTGFRFLVGDRVIYRIRVKNESDKTVENLKIEDTLPVHLKHDRGELSFEIVRLEPGQSEEKQIEAIVESFPDDANKACEVENVATAKNANFDLRDTSKICVAEKRLFDITVLPKTGASATVFAVIFSLLSGILGIFLVRLRKKSSFN